MWDENEIKKYIQVEFLELKQQKNIIYQQYKRNPTEKSNPIIIFIIAMGVIHNMSTSVFSFNSMFFWFRQKSRVLD